MKIQWNHRFKELHFFYLQSCNICVYKGALANDNVAGLKQRTPLMNRKLNMELNKENFIQAPEENPE